MFEDDEVLALVAALRMIEDRLTDDAAARALSKLIQVLPRRLNALAREVSASTESVPRRPPDLDLGLLATLTQAAAGQRIIAFRYVDQTGRASSRQVDSVHCVQSHGQWYVVAFDTGHDDWRLFRMDRMSEVTHGAQVVVDRGVPGGDLTAWLTTDFGRSTPGSS